MKRLLAAIFCAALFVAGMATAYADTTIPSLTLPITVATASTVQLVAASGDAPHYLSMFVFDDGTANTTVSVIQGTGTNCGSNQSTLVGGVTLSPGSPGFVTPILIRVPAGFAGCLVNSAAQQLGGYYDYF